METTENNYSNQERTTDLQTNSKKELEPSKRKTKQYPSCYQNTFYYFQSFSDNASIDGLKFVGEEGRTVIERIFWTIMVMVSLLLSTILVYQTYVKWINSPVLVTFDTAQIPLYNIPFPAITVCPEFKSKKDLFNFTDVYLKIDEGEVLTKYESDGYDALSLVCEPDQSTINVMKYFAVADDLSFLYKVAPTLADIMFNVYWRGELLKTAEAFVPVLTAEGVCYTFNSLDKSELFSTNVQFSSEDFLATGKKSQWTIENGYTAEADMDVSPRRTYVAGTNGGLRIHLHGRMTDLDYTCGEALQGFKVALHNPAETARVDQNYINVPINQAVVVGVKPSIMTTAKELEAYTPQDRHCYFEHERKLKFFKIYNQRNCLDECLANFTLNYCGCVSFYLPKNSTTSVCGIGNQRCVDKAKGIFLVGDVKKQIVQYTLRLRTMGSPVPKKLNDINVTFDDQCDCLPSCYSIDFNVETSQSDWNWKEAFKVKESRIWDEQFENHTQDSNLYLSEVTIYYKDMQFVSSERNELYGYTDFWANVGGIIGLFTGFSFITIFEILYYLSLRLTCNIKMYGCRFWSGSPKILNSPVFKSDY